MTIKSLSSECENHINRFVLKITFIRIYLYNFTINIFYIKEKSKLYFGDRVAVLNDL
jgi:hypothetical protein